MDKIRTKEAAEAALLELPSVLGAFVREDIYGHPREVHLLVTPAPNVRLLAKDVRDLLEERLQVPVDQRIISIAQVARDPRESAVSDVPAVATSAPEGLAARRMIFGGVDCMVRDARVVVRVRLSWQNEEYVGEASELDVGMGRVRAAALAALRAAASAARDGIVLELEGASAVRALERQYVLVSALAAAPSLGRRPLTLVGAHPADDDEATAAALAALKAVNRVVSLKLEAED